MLLVAECNIYRLPVALHSIMIKKIAGYSSAVRPLIIIIFSMNY